jgi:hypothetical protein
MIRRPTVTKVVEGIVFVRFVTKIPMTMFLRPMLLKLLVLEIVVGGMVWALAQNKPLKEVLRWE